MSRYDGILLLDKPEGITSARAVARVRAAVGGVKVGHLGTLDPFASGLLPLCIGAGRKIAQFLNVADKSYVGVIKLGCTSDTLDSTGEIGATGPVPALAEKDLRELEEAFTGKLEQVPPAFSAIKKDGVPMYRLARRGVDVELTARPVTIHRLVLSLLAPDLLEAELDCSKGTYVRALARDIGDHLGCGALLQTLRRTGFGCFRVEEGVPLDRVMDEATRAEALAGALVPLDRALSHLPTIEVDRGTAESLRHGRQAVLSRLSGGQCVSEARSSSCVMVTCEGSLVALVAADNGGWRLSRVFA